MPSAPSASRLPAWARPVVEGLVGEAAAAPVKPRSILIAEIVLAALVVITLTIGGCLLLK